RGAAPGLTPDGVRNAHELGRRLAGEPIAAIYSSPRMRAFETAAAIAAEAHLCVEMATALDEIDFGDWTGRCYSDLDGDPEWQEWNRHRSVAATPGGEPMAAVQKRAMAFIAQAAARHKGRTIVMVSHCDVIRAVLCALAGRSLDDL